MVVGQALKEARQGCVAEDIDWTDYHDDATGDRPSRNNMLLLFVVAPQTRGWTSLPATQAVCRIVAAPNARG